MGSCSIQAVQKIIDAAANGLIIELVIESLLRGHETTRYVHVDGRQYAIEGKLHPAPRIVMTEMQ